MIISFKKFVLLLLVTNMYFVNAVSQNCKLENMHYFSIKQNLKEFSEDSIRFLVSGNLLEKKPVVVFVQGSGNAPLALSFPDSTTFLYPLTHKELVEQLDSNVYKPLNKHKDFKNYFDNNINEIDKHSVLSNYSFNRNLSIFNLIKIKIPLLVVYGTADIKSVDLSLLPLFLFDTDVNYTIKAYPNYDHSYFLVDDDGKVVFEEFHFDDVFNDVLRWFSAVHQSD